MKLEKSLVPERLRAFFEANPQPALAFSGGCDSAYLLYAAAACGADVTAYYVRSQFQPAFELADAGSFAAMLGVKLRVLDVDVLADESIRRNAADRCYHCKRRIFEAILAAVEADGHTLLMDGTNASDDASDRPGMRALRELRVASPLRDCGIDKAQVRALSRQAGIFTWNKPAYACLATRIPTGEAIEAEVLRKIERAEAQLAELGFSGMRVRITPKGTRLELRESQMMRAIEKRRQLVEALEADFPEITLDLRPRMELEI